LPGGNAYEIMLWMNKQGAVGPIGSLQTSVSVGGHSWNVYKGSNGSNQVFRSSGPAIRIPARSTSKR
jgi:hypothetical protein